MLTEPTRNNTFLSRHLDIRQRRLNMPLMRPFMLAIFALSAVIAGYFIYQQLNRPAFALEVDATKDTTDISGIHYRIRIANVGTQPLTGIIAEMGVNDVENKDYLGPGQSYYFYPEPETQVSTVRISTNEGISIESDYRIPAKVLGLPGAGR